MREDKTCYEHLLREPCCKCRCRDTTSLNEIGYICLVNYDLKTPECELFMMISNPMREDNERE